MLGSILMVPVIIAVAAGSVVLISKVGGKSAGKRIQELHGMNEDADKQQ